MSAQLGTSSTSSEFHGFASWDVLFRLCSLDEVRADSLVGFRSWLTKVRADFESCLCQILYGFCRRAMVWLPASYFSVTLGACLHWLWNLCHGSCNRLWEKRNYAFCPYLPFLVACTRLYTQLCLSVRPSVRWYVCQSICRCVGQSITHLLFCSILFLIVILSQLRVYEVISSHFKSF